MNLDFRSVSYTTWAIGAINLVAAVLAIWKGFEQDWTKPFFTAVASVLCMTLFVTLPLAVALKRVVVAKDVVQGRIEKISLSLPEVRYGTHTTYDIKGINGDCVRTKEVEFEVLRHTEEICERIHNIDGSVDHLPALEVTVVDPPEKKGWQIKTHAPVRRDGPKRSLVYAWSLKESLQPEHGRRYRKVITLDGAATFGGADEYINSRVLAGESFRLTVRLRNVYLDTIENGRDHGITATLFDSTGPHELKPTDDDPSGGGRTLQYYVAPAIQDDLVQIHWKRTARSTAGADANLA